MKKRFQSILNELYKVFQEDEDSVEAIDYLLSKVNAIEDSKNESTHNNVFPLPKEVVNKDHSYALFSDGACRGNPGPGSWGVMGQNNIGDVIFESSGVDVPSTNNKMELEGAIQALKLLQSYLVNKGELEMANVFLYSDSKYVVDGITKWVPGWKKKGWKKSDNKVPENVEQWKSLDLVKNEFKNLNFLWVKGHAGHPQNEHCDALANQALDESGL